MNDKDWVSKMDGVAKYLLGVVLGGVLVGLIYGFVLAFVRG